MLKKYCHIVFVSNVFHICHLPFTLVCVSIPIEVRFHSSNWGIYHLLLTMESQNPTVKYCQKIWVFTEIWLVSEDLVLKFASISGSSAHFILYYWWDLSVKQLP